MPRVLKLVNMINMNHPKRLVIASSENVLSPRMPGDPYGKKNQSVSRLSHYL